MAVVIKGGASAEPATAERPANRRFDLGLIETSIGPLNKTLQPVGWLARDKVDEAAGRVTTEQGALWPLQYLDSFDIERAKILALKIGNIPFVDIDRDRGFDTVVEVVLGHAANRKLRILAADTTRYADTRRESRDVDAGGHAERLDLLAAECRDRDANILQILLAALSGDDNFVHDPARDLLRLGIGCRHGGRVLRRSRGGKRCESNERAPDHQYSAHMRYPLLSAVKVSPSRFFNSARSSATSTIISSCPPTIRRRPSSTRMSRTSTP